MKNYFLKFCAAFGGCLIGFWVWSLDTTVGRLFFLLGIFLLAGAWLTSSRNKKEIK